MSQSIYLLSYSHNSGKLFSSIGLLDTLLKRYKKVAYYKPILKGDSSRYTVEIENIKKHFDLDIEIADIYLYTMEYTIEMLAKNKKDEIIDGVFDHYKELEKEYDFIIVDGLSILEDIESVEILNLNKEIVRSLNSRVVFVIDGKDKSKEEIKSMIYREINILDSSSIEVLFSIVNKVKKEEISKIQDYLKKEGIDSYCLPYQKKLGYPSVQEVADQINARVIYGEEYLGNTIENVRVITIGLQGHLERMEKENSLMIFAYDRLDILFGTIIASMSNEYPKISGILLTCGDRINKEVERAIKGIKLNIPIIIVNEETFPSSIKVQKIRPTYCYFQEERFNLIRDMFENYIDQHILIEQLSKESKKIMTPKMFLYNLLEKAKKNKKTIVLPEGIEPRILKATEILLRREVVNVVLLGNRKKIEEKAQEIGVNINNATIVDPEKSKDTERYSQILYEIRKSKGVTLEMAKDMVVSNNYFGTMMVYMGDVDGMVSGAIHSTQDTIRPAFQIVKTRKDTPIVSSIFFMCLEDKILVYGDCAINVNPGSEDLANIAISSEKTARAFGIDPRVALLSYSTGISGKGIDVEKVKGALDIILEKKLDIIVDGPIQYDAAVSEDVGKSKMPESKVAGRANVLIFPDLNTGNNTYKAVQREAQGIAIGPVLQGLNKPINDLSRGCLIEDIVNTVIVTAIQAIDDE